MRINREGLGRRQFIGHVAGGALLASAASSVGAQPTVSSGTVTVEALPYAYDALEPYIDAETMHLHHDKHYQAYADGLNKALKQAPALQSQSPDSLLKNLSGVPQEVRTAVRNSGGGYVNHKLFWPSLKKNNGQGPRGELAAAIDKHFNSFSSFQAQFSKAAAGVFGSGWAWLSLTAEKQLLIAQTPNQDSVLSEDQQPVFGIDVWEHAYYLKYKNRRPEYIAAFYQVIDWDHVSSRYTDLLKS